MVGTNSDNLSKLPIKILYIEDVAEIAGGPNSLLQLTAGLDKDRFEPHLICPPGPFEQESRRIGIKIETMQLNTRYESIPLLFGLKLRFNPIHMIRRLSDSFKIKNYIRKNEIDIVHTNDLDAHIIGWFLQYIFRVKVLWHIRITTWPKILYKIPKVTKIIFVSDYTKEYSIGKANRSSNFVVVYNGINIEKFANEAESSKDIKSVREEFSIPDDAKIIGVVGRVKKQKRQEILIKVTQKLKKSGLNIRCMIVGDQRANRKEDSYMEDLNQLAKELDVEKEMIFTGNRTDIARIMNAFDVFIFPAENDSNPRVVLEAMALKIPIVGNKTGGILNMLDNGNVSPLVELDDDEAYYEAAKSLLTNSERYQKISQNVFNRLKEKYTIEDHVSNMQKVYEEIFVN